MALVLLRLLSRARSTIKRLMLTPSRAAARSICSFSWSLIRMSSPLFLPVLVRRALETPVASSASSWSPVFLLHGEEFHLSVSQTERAEAAVRQHARGGPLETCCRKSGGERQRWFSHLSKNSGFASGGQQLRPKAGARTSASQQHSHHPGYLRAAHHTEKAGGPGNILAFVAGAGRSHWVGAITVGRLWVNLGGVEFGKSFAMTVTRE